MLESSSAEMKLFKHSEKKKMNYSSGPLAPPKYLFKKSSIYLVLLIYKHISKEHSQLEFQTYCMNLVSIAAAEQCSISSV